MTRGLALSLGLNSVDPGHYAGWSGELLACEADATDMTSIAKTAGFEATTLLTRAATRGAVKAAVLHAAKNLKSGDMFMLSYSGHGGQLPDMNDDEPDGQDETWCLYDGEQVDDELYLMLSEFAHGVRILVFSDSCHSGTAIRAHIRALQATGAMEALGGPVGDSRGRTSVRYRAMPPDVALRTYRANREFYDGILTSATRGDVAKLKATAILISGCQDNQLSADGEFNGLFTGRLLRVWKRGLFKGDYRAFHRKIARLMPPMQSPNYFVVGEPHPTFERQRPFQLKATPPAERT